MQDYERSSDISIQAKGKGFCFCYVSYKYNTNKLEPNLHFNLSATTEAYSSCTFLALRIKINYIPNVETGDIKSNRTVMEICLPSGFIGDEEKLSELVGTNRIFKTALKAEGTVLLIYFEYCDEEELEFVVTGHQIVIVGNFLPVPIRITDCYDNRKLRRFF